MGELENVGKPSEYSNTLSMSILKKKPFQVSKGSYVWQMFP